jgi:hypothetical protein
MTDFGGGLDAKRPGAEGTGSLELLSLRDTDVQCPCHPKPIFGDLRNTITASPQFCDTFRPAAPTNIRLISQGYCQFTPRKSSGVLRTQWPSCPAFPFSQKKEDAEASPLQNSYSLTKSAVYQYVPKIPSLGAANTPSGRASFFMDMRE